jgi:hypothetical protein
MGPNRFRSRAGTDHKSTRQAVAEPGGKNSSPYFRKSFPTPPGKSSFSRRETLSRRAAAITKVSGPDLLAPHEVERRTLNRRAQRSQRG